MSKKLLLLLSCLVSLQAVAQPNIQKSLHLAEKHCWPYFGTYGSMRDMTYIPHAGYYAIASPEDALTPNSGEDILLIKIDTLTHDTLWTKVYGGSGTEQAAFMYINTLPNGHI